ncbi:MAG: SpoIIE family protein phosphatase [Spirochaetes bacterium]|nr:SpoIIE family protein phosphatase [Spirochaetota bacterium]MBU0955269.1 SpoIIE family protein phosphatase [Spirochaetota bacterium]
MKRKCLILLVLVLAFSGATLLYAQRVDLTALPAYVRDGFSSALLLRSFNPNDPAWVQIPANPGNRPIQLRDIPVNYYRQFVGTASSRSFILSDIPEEALPRYSLFNFRKNPPQQYTILIPFEASLELIESKSGVGLFLGGIGTNWQMYLNGSLYFNQASSGFLSIDEGVQRAVRGVVLDLEAREMQEGLNTLAFMIEGDPEDPRTGLFMEGPYIIDSFEKVLAMRNQYLTLAFIGAYLFFSVYHLVLFALRPKNKAYLMYALGIGLLAVHLFSRTFIVYDLIQNSAVVRSMELVTLIALVPIFLAFYDTAVRHRATRFTWIFGAIALVPLVAQFLFRHEPVQFLWTIVAFLPAAYVLVMDFILPIRRSWRHFVRTAVGRPNYFKVLAMSFRRLNGAQLLLGIAVIGAMTSLNVLSLSSGIFESIAQYGFFLLTFGSATVLAAQFVHVYGEVEAINVVLENKVESRTRELEDKMREQDSLNVKLSETSDKLKEANEEAATDMRMAVQVQQGFFPKEQPRTTHWEASSALLPAAGISGDFFDFYLNQKAELDGLVVGDVSGHGIASGLVTVLARSVFHRNFYDLRQKSLSKVMDSINEEMIAELEAVDNYLTAALLRLSDDGFVEYTSAAHTEILYRGVGKPRAVELKPKGVDDYKGWPIGRSGFDRPFKSIRFKLNPGDALLIYTDGLSEARNVDQEEYGLEGVVGSLSSAPDEDARSMLNYIMQEWRFHTSGSKIADDVTAVLLRYRG